MVGMGLAALGPEKYTGQTALGTKMYPGQAAPWAQTGAQVRQQQYSKLWPVYKGNNCQVPGYTFSVPSLSVFNASIAQWVSLAIHPT